MVANGNAVLVGYVEMPHESFPVVPASSPYKSVCDQIAFDLAAIDPPDEITIGYFRNEDEEVDLGASSDRAFRFRWLKAKKVGFQGSFIRYREEFELLIFLAGGRHNVRTLDESVRHEALFIASQIDYREQWPFGASHVNAVDISARPKGNEDAELVIRITFESQNSRPVLTGVL